MAEVGAVTTIIQVADVGLRLSTTLFVFAETVANADKAVNSISKDVSLTSSVLKELANILQKDNGPQAYSNTAVASAVAVVRECSDVFQEVENILIEKLPKLSSRRKDKTSRTTVALERLKWPYLQPKINLLRSNLDRLKSSLLVILNVISLAKLMKTEPSSVDAGQTALVKDLIQSNQEHVRRYEELKHSIMTTSARTPFSQLNTCSIKEPRLQDPHADCNLKYETRLDNLHHFVELFERLQQEVKRPSYAIGSQSRSRIEKHIADARCSETGHLSRLHGEETVKDAFVQFGLRANPMNWEQAQHDSRPPWTGTISQQSYSGYSPTQAPITRYESARYEDLSNKKTDRPSNIGFTPEQLEGKGSLRRQTKMEDLRERDPEGQRHQQKQFKTHNVTGEVESANILPITVSTTATRSAADPGAADRLAAELRRDYGGGGRVHYCSRSRSGYLGPWFFQPQSRYTNPYDQIISGEYAEGKQQGSISKDGGANKRNSKQLGNQEDAQREPDIKVQEYEEEVQHQKTQKLQATEQASRGAVAANAANVTSTPRSIMRSRGTSLSQDQPHPTDEYLKRAGRDTEEVEDARSKEFEEGEDDEAHKERTNLFTALKEGFGSSSAVDEKAILTSGSSSTMPPLATAGHAKLKPAALKLETSKPFGPGRPDAQLESLVSARPLSMLDNVSYPLGIVPPDPTLKQDITLGKLHYERKFLLQFSGLFGRQSALAKEHWLKQFIIFKQASFAETNKVDKPATHKEPPYERPSHELRPTYKPYPQSLATASQARQKLPLGDFLPDTSLGSWADEMEDMPKASGTHGSMPKPAILKQDISDHTLKSNPLKANSRAEASVHSRGVEPTRDRSDWADNEALEAECGIEESRPETDKAAVWVPFGENMSHKNSMTMARHSVDVKTIRGKNGMPKMNVFPQCVLEQGSPSDRCLEVRPTTSPYSKNSQKGVVYQPHSLDFSLQDSQAAGAMFNLSQIRHGRTFSYRPAVIATSLPKPSGQALHPGTFSNASLEPSKFKNCGAGPVAYDFTTHRFIPLSWSGHGYCWPSDADDSGVRFRTGEKMLDELLDLWTPLDGAV